MLYLTVNRYPNLTDIYGVANKLTIRGENCGRPFHYCSLKLAFLSHSSQTVASPLLNRSGGGHQFSLSVVDSRNGSAAVFCDD